MSLSKPVLPQALYETLADVCQKFSDGRQDNSQLVAFKDIIFDSCKQHNYAETRVMHVKSMGCHHKNRDGAGIHTRRAISRIVRIKSAGFSHAALFGNLVGIEDHPIDKTIEKFTLSMCARSPEYAQYKEGDIKGGTLGGSHCTHGLAMVYDERPCNVPEISEQGHISQSICFKDRLLKAATMEGMEYFMIKWEVEAVFPTVPIIVQAALNTVSQIAEGESWPQILCKILHECGTQKDEHGDIAFRQVQVQVIKSQPPRAQDVPDMTEYVRVWGGLPTGSHIHELNLLSSLLPSDRIVSGSFFKWLTSLRHSFSVENMPSHFINAVLFCHAASNEGVVDDFARFLSKGDVSSLGSKSKAATVIAANQVLARGRQLVEGLGVRGQLEFLPTLKTDVVLHVLAKKGHTDKRSLEEIATAFATRVSCADQPQVPEVPKPVQSEPRNIVHYDSGGEVIKGGRTTVTNKGFAAGLHVMQTKNADESELVKDRCKQWVIREIQDDGSVVLQKVQPDGSVDVDAERATIAIDEFLRMYSVVDKIQLVSHFPVSDASNSVEIQKLALKGQVEACVCAMTREYPAADVTIMSNPVKKLMATRLFKTKELTLVPATLSVSIEQGGKACPARSVECSFGADSTMKVFLNPMAVTKDFTAPFWAMKCSPKLGDSNMVLEQVRYMVKAPTSKEDDSAPWIVFNAWKAVNRKVIRQWDEIILHRPSIVEPAGQKRKSTTIEIDVAKRGRA